MQCIGRLSQPSSPVSFAFLHSMSINTVSVDISYKIVHSITPYVQYVMRAGSFLYTSPYFTRLPLADRLTALPLVGPLLEHDRDEATYARYDAMTARALFLRAGVSPRLLRWVHTLTIGLPEIRYAQPTGLDLGYL
jgi:hypothetical protein